ncbi:MAG: 3-oxoacyl-ACP reductase [Proteobacteria bacterium]|nr:MAG: 3-oxoacyl-ACP reductase [Pseudomonadota bacterium]
MQRLAGKVALIVGAGSVGPGWGNGRAISVLFAREGAKVFGADKSIDAAAETKRLAEAEGHTIAIGEVDVTNPESIKAMVDACLQTYGRIDVLVNNVGGSAPGDVVSMPLEVWDRQFDVNVRYVFLTCKHVIPIMVRQGGGSIVNLSSIAALAHFGPEVVAYSTAKAGLIQFTRVTAVRYAPNNVRCNIIVPGLMDTPLVEHRLAGERSGGDVEALRRRRNSQPPMGRMGTAWDVAYAALFLASDEARYITGAELVVDGGLSATVRLASEN